MIPRAIPISVVAVSVLYALMNLSIIAVVPWREAMQSSYIVTDFMQRLYGPRAASVVTLLVLWTALASVLALLLGYSRIAYAAASKGDFFRVFARAHPEGQFPHVAVLVLGGLSIAFSFFVRRRDLGVAHVAHRGAVHGAGGGVAPAAAAPGIRAPVPMWPIPAVDHCAGGVELRLLDERVALCRLRHGDVGAGGGGLSRARAGAAGLGAGRAADACAGATSCRRAPGRTDRRWSRAG
ncbi:MAG: APC family permease [Gemmatimonadetes bacterium]|nr:APC family permease [Gemmatimonadota bacterium]